METKRTLLIEITVTPMHSIYPNEVLHFRQRAKGMGMYSLFQAIFAIVLTYGASAAIAIIGWKVWVSIPLPSATILTRVRQIYFVFIAIDLAALCFTYFLFPEFKGLSLEEIDLIFETPDTTAVKVANRLQKSKRERREHELSPL